MISRVSKNILIFYAQLLLFRWSADGQREWGKLFRSWGEKSEGGVKLEKGPLPDFSSPIVTFFFSFTSSQIDGGVSVRSIAWEYLLTPWSKYPNSSSLDLSDSSSQWKPSREPRPSAEITLLGRGKQEPIKLTFGFANKGLGAGQLTCGQPFGAAFLKTTVMERFLWGCRATIDIKSRRNAC